VGLHGGIADEDSRLYAYVVVSLLTGIRTEEARALLWSHVVARVDRKWHPVTEVGFSHKKFAIYVWRSVRANGDTKTEKSRRTLELPGRAANALREHHARQAKERLAAGEDWQDHGLVFVARSMITKGADTINTIFKQAKQKSA
jgi:integrase